MMANTSIKGSPLTPLLGLSESFFHASPFNSSSDSSFGIEWRKRNNLNQQNQSRTFSPASRFVNSPNISPIIKKLGNMTIAEEPDDPSCEKTFVINSINGIDSPHTPVNTTFVIDQEMKYHKNMAAQKQIFMDRKKAHKRRTMFLLPPTPTTIRDSSKLNASDFEHKFAVETILKEIGLTKYINLFESEEINIPAFLTLDDKDLQTIGIIDPEERCEIMKAVDTYQFLK